MSPSKCWWSPHCPSLLLGAASAVGFKHDFVQSKMTTSSFWSWQFVTCFCPCPCARLSGDRWVLRPRWLITEAFCPTLLLLVLLAQPRSCDINYAKLIFLRCWFGQTLTRIQWYIPVHLSLSHALPQPPSCPLLHTWALVYIYRVLQGLPLTRGTLMKGPLQLLLGRQLGRCRAACHSKLPLIGPY